MYFFENQKPPVQLVKFDSQKQLISMSWLFIVNNKKNTARFFWIKNIHHNLYSLIPKQSWLFSEFKKKNLASQLALELIEWAVSF